MAKNRPGEIVKDDLLDLTKSIAKNKNRLQLAAVQKVSGLLTTRIFNNGLATDGGNIGTYAPSTLFSKRRRKRLGTQTGNRVNLQDSGVLFESIQTGKSGNDVVLGIVDTNYPDGFNTSENAVTQENHFGKDIFAPTDQEVKAGEDAMLKELLIITKAALK